MLWLKPRFAYNLQLARNNAFQDYQFSQTKRIGDFKNRERNFSNLTTVSSVANIVEPFFEAYVCNCESQAEHEISIIQKFKANKTPR